MNNEKVTTITEEPNPELESFYKEIWKPIEGFETQYLFSNYGRVMALERKDYRGKHRKPKILKPLFSSGSSGHYLLATVDLFGAPAKKCFQLKKILKYILKRKRFYEKTPTQGER